MRVLQLAALVAAGAVSAAAADATLLGLLPSDSKIVAGVHFDRVVSSSLGQFALAQAGTGDSGFQSFIKSTHFDPRRDLHEIVIVSTDNVQKGHGLVLARGNFDIPNLLAAARLSGASVVQYGGLQVIAGKETHAGWVAFLDGATAVMGEPAMVKTVVDRHGASQPLPVAISNKVADLSGRYDVWFLSTLPVSQLNPGVPDARVNKAVNGDLFQSIQQASGGINLGSMIQLNGEAVTRSSQDAQSLVDVVRFLASMAQSTKDNPESAHLATILDTLQLSTSGSSMLLQLSLLETDLERMIQQQKQTGGHHVAVKKVLFR